MQGLISGLELSIVDPTKRASFIQGRRRGLGFRVEGLENMMG